ncbi:hypothetical protein [Methylobacterium sp. E-066]|uniref:hypothetical protein n=1 Tax=Methylobacterium sp. E-066 TaxID=2836584 RepID=UPI001FB8FFFB|nr:hypothetical protein [Methylobacterium sp. E-066]MCJ2141908.1 hypothetical protein [Methylobacterium sp. E-066]
MPDPTDRRSRYEIEALERHAAAQAKYNHTRIEICAPRREDVARIALFVTLMQYRGSKHDGARAVVRMAMVDLLVDAGFDREAAGKTFDSMVPRVGDDLDSYLMKRKADRAVRNGWRARNGLASLPDRSAADKE